MEYKKVYIFLLVSASLTHFVTSSQKYEQISSCESTSDTCDGCRYGKFICGEFNNLKSILNYDPSAIECQNHGWYKKYFGTIDFENCRFKEIQTNFFDIFKTLHTFNISYLELESLNPASFEGAANLTHLIASHNNLTDVPSLLFVSAHKLAHVDFSNNKIHQISEIAFAGASSIEWLDLSFNYLTEFNVTLSKSLANLKTLNLSHNKLSSSDLHIPAAPSLLRLDISSNNLTDIDENIVEKTTKLIYLNMSFNPLTHIKMNTFLNLIDLEHLDLKHTNISTIQLGTFSHQHKLISLDLSENNLKKFDFKLFFPIMHDLKLLWLGGNQIKELISFRNAVFPRLELLDITNNAFNCTYLHQFMENIDWAKLHLHLAPKSNQHGDRSIRGVICNDTVYEPIENGNENIPRKNESLEYITNENISRLLFTINNLRDDLRNNFTSTKIMLFLMLMLLFSYLAVYLIINRDQIRNQTTRYSENIRISVAFNSEQNETLLL